MNKTITTSFISLCCLGAASLNAERWSPAPINNAGGEGGQVITSINVDPSEGDYLIFGTDVGGMCHSTDGGENWIMTNIGFEAQASIDQIVDPKNNQVIYAMGNGHHHGFKNVSNGVYRSRDQGLTWEWVYRDDEMHKKDRGDRRRHLAIDPTSFDESLGYCTTIYYAQKRLGKYGKSQVFKSTDAGDTWAPLTSIEGTFHIGANEENGDVFLANGEGFFRSTDKGETFVKMLELEQIRAFDNLGHVVALGTNDRKVFVSTDGGATFEQKAATGFFEDEGWKIRRINISPADTNRMTVTLHLKTGGNGSHVFYTHDGGDTWKPSKYVSGHQLVGTTYFQGQGDQAWHPKNKDIVWTSCKNFIVKSTDGGATFHWSNKGYSGIFFGQKNTFHFNVHNPDYVAWPSIDFRGSVTFDGGKEFHDIKIGNGYWGWVYGAYAVEPGVWFGGRSKKHSPAGVDLWITRNWGKSFEKKKLSMTVSGNSRSCYQSPVNKDTWFYYKHRSTDAGRTWKTMKGCTAVVTHSLKDNSLFGLHGGKVQHSTDDGATWKTLFKAGEPLNDVAFDHEKNVVFALTRGKLLRHDMTTGKTINLYNRLPKDQKNANPRLWSVAVDPVDTNIVYTVNGAHRYQPDNSVMRSLDSGKTWHSITVAKRWDNLHLRAPGGGGCTEGLWVRVHPKTRFAYVGTNDFGYWKIGPPETKGVE